MCGNKNLELITYNSYRYSEIMQKLLKYSHHYWQNARGLDFSLAHTINNNCEWSEVSVSKRAEQALPD